MASTFRKRLTKRSGTVDLKKTNDADSDKSTSSGSMNTPEASDGDATLTVPPLPVAKDPATTRSSPSKSLFHRYSARAKEAREVPTISTDVTPPKESKINADSRHTALTEHFDEKSPTSPDEVNEPATSTDELPQTVRTVDGVDYIMVGGKQSDMTNEDLERPNASDISRRSSLESSSSLLPRRSTRSQTRRQERIDSHVSAMGGTSDVKDFATKKRGSLDLPRPLSIRLKDHDQSTPRTPSPNASVIKGSATPYNSPGVASPAVTHNTEPTPPKPTDSPDPLLGPSPPPSPPRRTASEAEESLRSYLNTKSEGVIVHPPTYNPEQNVMLQWASQFSGTSRPTAPWLWCKRWTCCCCGAQTIVEQKECARLTCGHMRCGASCKLIRHA